MSRILAVVNPQAAVGKTTTAITLAGAFAVAGQASLIVDLDVRGSASTALGVTQANSGLLQKILQGTEPPNKTGLLVRSVDAGLDLIPSDVALSSVEDEEPGGLDAAVGSLRPQYPWIILDCPPSRGFFTKTAARAADLVIVPVPAETSAVDRVGRFLIEAGLEELSSCRLVTTMIRGSGVSSTYEPKRFFRTHVPYDPEVPEATSSSRTVLQHDIESGASRAYAQLAKEIMDHGG